MFYTTSDMIILSKVAARKSCELAMLAYDKTGRNHVLISKLLDDIARIRLIADVHSNSFVGIAERMYSFLEDLHRPVAPAYASYLESLQLSDRIEEEAYQSLVMRLVSCSSVIFGGIDVSPTISSGQSPFGTGEVASIIRARDIFHSISLRSSELPDDAARCNMTLGRMSRQLLRVHSGRGLTNSEISDTVDDIAEADLDGYLDSLLPGLSPEDARAVEGFVGDCGLYRSILCGRAVSNSALMIPSEI